ncbi:Mov34/MPN/PAD-1 family protein [Candidatus Woesearchaeota archaeon]|nr:Mov34/MPN/PAD-1 family protein [Candidatus Woesearchaeota archaeon]
MKNLDFLLNQEEPEENKKEEGHNLGTIHVTEYAFEKAFAYARLMCSIAGRTMECGGYLIAPKDSKDLIATDAYLARDQEVQEGFFEVHAEDVIKAGRELDKQGFKVLGWWHSHGFLRTFFSGTDDKGQRTVLNEISAVNYISIPEEKELKNLESKVENGKLLLFDKKNPLRKYELQVKGDPNTVKVEGLKLLGEKRVGFAYGLVVNAWKDKRVPYAEIATRDLCFSCRKSRDESERVSVTVYDTGDHIIDGNELRKELREKVRYERRRYVPKQFNFKGFKSLFRKVDGIWTPTDQEKPKDDRPAKEELSAKEEQPVKNENDRRKRD